MSDRFDSYLRHAAELVSRGDHDGAAGHERLALQTLQALGSPPHLAFKLHAQRGRRAMGQADFPVAEKAFADAVASLREAGGGGRELLHLLQRLGSAQSRRDADERALATFDEAIALAASIGPAYYPVAYAHIARAGSLMRLARRDEAQSSLSVALTVAEHAPADHREKIARMAHRALDDMSPQPAPRGDEGPPRRAPPAGSREPRGAPLPAGARAHVPSSPAAAPDPASMRFDQDTFNDVLAELDGLIGLAAVKAEVRRLAELLRIASMRHEAGLKTVQVSLHLVFEGGAGTGKTTVARLFGRLYKSLGLLASDRVVEVTREDLVSGYVGQTATKTGAAIDSALDGVLFLDEAYALVRPDSHGDFGPEAVAELLKRMEDDRARLAVIVAGYPHEMTEFLASNSGFRSRFGETIHFVDYEPAELVQIFEKFAADADYALSADARAELARVMERLHFARDRYFGNARTARNLFDDVIAHQAERLLAGDGTPDRAALVELIVADVRAAGR